MTNQPEAFSRVLIDQALKDGGWNLLDSWKMAVEASASTIIGADYVFHSQEGFCPAFPDTALRLIMSQEGCHGTETKGFSGVQA
jgi:hypothetical protein